MAAGHIACEFNIRGPTFNTLTACAASTQAIGEATNMIRRVQSAQRAVRPERCDHGCQPAV